MLVRYVLALLRRRLRDHAVDGHWTSTGRSAWRGSTGSSSPPGRPPAWSGPLVVATLKDSYPDRAIIYSFLLNILVLGVAFTFSFLVNDERFVPRRISPASLSGRVSDPPEISPRKSPVRI